MRPSYIAEPPAFGEPVEIDPGIFWLRLPLPFALDHVNLWLLDDGDGWTVIDAGHDNPDSRAIWEAQLAGILRGRPVRRLIATHFHPDHLGCARYLCDATGAELWMSRTEWLMGRMMALDASHDLPAHGERYDRLAGLDPALIEARAARGNLYRRGVGLPPAHHRRVRAGETIAMAGSTWRVMTGEGHAPEMLTFYSEARGLLIAADHILPRISPVIGLWPMNPEPDPLGDYLRTLIPYRDLPGDTRVLPGHDAPFTGLHDRLDSLRAHHGARLRTALRLCAEPKSAFEVMPHLFRRKIDDSQVGFAIAETLAHLRHLEELGLMERAVAADGRELHRALAPQSAISPDF